MNSDQVMQVAARHIESEWTRLGIVGSPEEKAAETRREYDRLSRALSILQAAGCLVTPPSTEEGPR